MKSEHCAGRQPIGFVKDETPLLEKPLEGPAYAVSGFANGKNVLPHIAFILGGQVTVVPQAESMTLGGGRLKTVVPVIPDVPIGHFRFTLLGRRPRLHLKHRKPLRRQADRRRDTERPKRQDPDPAGEDEDRLQGKEATSARQGATGAAEQRGKANL